MIEPHASNILSKLAEVGETSDDEIDVFEAALLIAALDHPGRSQERYILHRDRMVEACMQVHKTVSSESAKSQLSTLREVLYAQEEYNGDSETYDHLDNADLMSVIDRRKGLPVTLAIIYMSVGQRLGWDVEVLSFPAHVFLRISCLGERIIFDPFDGAKEMEAHDLREKMKMLIGQHAELSAEYYNPVGPRDVIVRLQNNIKTRLISDEDYESALQRIDIMRLVLPQDPRLLFEAGVLNARAGQRRKAIELLYQYVDVVESEVDRDDALLLLHELEGSLH